MRTAAIQILICLALVLLPAWPCPTVSAVKGDDFAEVKKRLVKDGFSAEQIDAIYGASGVAFETKGVSSFFVHSEAKLNYNQFSTEASIANAEKYLEEYADDLERASRQYGVEPEVITAIILVETRLGTLTGNTPVLNVLSSMASLDEPAVRAAFWKRIQDKSRLTSKTFNEKADKKADWAYRELKAYLIYAQNTGIQAAEVKGSYAGAMGICQFMPGNIAPYGADGNGDGRVDLFDHADAIASVASYLKHYGWRPGISYKQAYAAVRHYNHSDPYVKAILTVRKKLKEKKS